MKMERRLSSKEYGLSRLVSLESENSWKLLLYPGRWILLILTMLPTLYALYLSMHQYNLARADRIAFVFLNNFWKVLTDTRFWNAFGVTSFFTLVSLAIEMVIGMLLALSLSRKIVAKRVVQIIILLPMITTPVVVGLIWKMFFDAQFGMLSYYYSLVTGDALNVLGSSSTALWGLIIADVWEWTPYVTLILLSGIQSLPQEPFEAVRVDGATGMQTFWHLTLPLLRPVIGIAVMFRFMELFKWMDTIYIMTGGGPGASTETLSYYAYAVNFKFLEVGYAAALCLVMLICVLIICNTIGIRVLARGDN